MPKQTITKKAKPAACAFIATSFGFGPASKATTIARQIKLTYPQMQNHFFGSGIDYEFAQQSGVFDKLFRINVDKSQNLKKLLPTLITYVSVFSILNLHILPLWRKEYGKLYFIDSLAWMWKEPPFGIENATIYFVQDYLVSPERINIWKKQYPLILIPPIGILPTKIVHSDNNLTNRQNHLLVNFSGCSNPFVKPDLYKKYVVILTSIIHQAAKKKFEEIKVCANRNIVDWLKTNFPDDPSLKFEFLSQQEFIQTLLTSRFLFTSPGITATLEAVSTNTPVGFLLPQNDSQAVMSEIYRKNINQRISTAFSYFSQSLAFPLSLDDFDNAENAVLQATNTMNFILDNKKFEIKEMIQDMLSNSTNQILKQLRKNILQKWDQTGQEAIINKIFVTQ